MFSTIIRDREELSEQIRALKELKELGRIYGFDISKPATDVKEAGRNPKRVQREVRKQMQNTGVGTKSQQALKLQQEQLKTERKIVNREQREAEKQRLFELKQKKRKEKHRGR